MFAQTWKKYLPVIRILLKRSSTGVQILDMNKSDFLRAAGGKKVKYTFSTILVKGRLSPSDNPTPVLRDLVTVLQDDEVSKKFMRQHEMELVMNSECKLAIKNKSPELAGESQFQPDAAALYDGGQTAVK